MSDGPEPSIATSVFELPWFMAVLEKSEKLMSTVPDDQLSSWYKQYAKF